MTFFYVKQVPVLNLDSLRRHNEFLRQRVLELCYTAWDMSGFAASLGWQGPPFRWDLERRALIRSEIDALIFRLYRIGRADVDYIMDRFKALRKAEIRQWGEYKTKHLILERYDAMAQAELRDQSYKTPLSPEPAHHSATITVVQRRDALSQP